MVTGVIRGHIRWLRRTEGGDRVDGLNENTQNALPGSMFEVTGGKPKSCTVMHLFANKVSRCSKQGSLFSRNGPSVP